MSARCRWTWKSGGSKLAAADLTQRSASCRLDLEIGGSASCRWTWTLVGQLAAGGCIAAVAEDV